MNLNLNLALTLTLTLTLTLPYNPKPEPEPYLSLVCLFCVVVGGDCDDVDVLPSRGAVPKYLVGTDTVSKIAIWGRSMGAVM